MAKGKTQEISINYIVLATPSVNKLSTRGTPDPAKPKPSAADPKSKTSAPLPNKPTGSEQIKPDELGE